LRALSVSMAPLPPPGPEDHLRCPSRPLTFSRNRRSLALQQAVTSNRNDCSLSSETAGHFRPSYTPISLYSRSQSPAPFRPVTQSRDLALWRCLHSLANALHARGLHVDVALCQSS